MAGVISFVEQHPLITYPIFFIGAYIEMQLPFAFFIPGEVFFYSAGILAAAGALDLGIVDGALIAGGLLADTTNFYLGRYAAAPVERFLRSTGLLERIYERAATFVRRHDARSLLFARFLGPVAWVTPFLAGSSGVPARRFFFFAPIAAAIAISLNVGVGYAIGVGYRFATTFLHEYAPLLSIAVFMVAIGIPFLFSLRETPAKRHAEHSEESSKRLE